MRLCVDRSKAPSTSYLALDRTGGVTVHYKIRKRDRLKKYKKCRKTRGRNATNKWRVFLARSIIGQHSTYVANHFPKNNAVHITNYTPLVGARRDHITPYVILFVFVNLQV